MKTRTEVGDVVCYVARADISLVLTSLWRETCRVLYVMLLLAMPGWGIYISSPLSLSFTPHPAAETAPGIFS